MDILVVEKKEDLPTEEEIKRKVGGLLKKILLPNGDVMVSCQETSTNKQSVNFKAIEIYKRMTGFDSLFYGHCFLIKKKIAII